MWFSNICFEYCEHSIRVTFFISLSLCLSPILFLRWASSYLRSVEHTISSNFITLSFFFPNLCGVVSHHIISLTNNHLLTTIMLKTKFTIIKLKTTHVDAHAHTKWYINSDTNRWKENNACAIEWELKHWAMHTCMSNNWLDRQTNEWKYVDTSSRHFNSNEYIERYFGVWVWWTFVLVYRSLNILCLGYFEFSLRKIVLLSGCALMSFALRFIFLHIEHSR